MHTSISPIFSYKFYSVATPRHPKPFPLENHGCIVALISDLQRVSFYSITDFLYHSFTTELILSLILIKGSYLSSKALLLYRKSLLALWLLWHINSGKVLRGLIPWVEATNDIWVRAKRPRTSYNESASLRLARSLRTIRNGLGIKQLTKTFKNIEVTKYQNHVIKINTVRSKGSRV